MYIPIWLIIAGVIIYFLWFRKKNVVSDGEPTTVEEMWRSAEWSMGRVMEKSPLSGLEEIGSFKDEREMVKAMETDAIRLRERYKHDPEKQKRIARDWMDYAKAVQEVKSAREMLDVDWEDGAYDRFDVSTKESYAIIHEVAKRVEDELGKDSHLKVVHDRLRKHAQIANEVLTKSAEKMEKEKKA
jgi:hypothetical protein